jgi:sugar phosphate isomerase/epimerase
MDLSACLISLMKFAHQIILSLVAHYDPSNTYLAGEDPLELLKRVSHRVITMHASDRYLKEGTIEDLRKEEGGAAGYAKRLSHGEIGKGLNDYDSIFAEFNPESSLELKL